jgi:hypothetical protein
METFLLPLSLARTVPPSRCEQIPKHYQSGPA